MSSVPARARAVVVWSFVALIIGAVSSPVMGDSGPVRGQWPNVRRGRWSLHATRDAQGGKKRSWNDSASACADPTELFRGYWGLAPLDEAGCRYDAVKISDKEFKISSECMVRRGCKARSEAKVTINDQDSFQMRVEVTEGKRRYVATQTGRRIADCEQTAPNGRSGS